MTDQHDPIDDPQAPRFTPANAAIAGLTVLVLMVLVAVLAYLAFENEDDVVMVDDTATTSPTTFPTTGVPDEPATPAGADSALVGLTELEVRELYPLVRIVELDGEALPATMDLQPGRLNLSIEGGVVVAATAEGCEELTSEDAAWMQQACDPDPDSDGPDANGKLLEGEDGTLTLEVGTQGEQYYQGMTVAADPDQTRVVDTQGTPLSADDLGVGDVVWMWTDACLETSPVQCEIRAIVVDRPAG